MPRFLIPLAAVCLALPAGAQVIAPTELLTFVSPALDESGLGLRGSFAPIADVDGDGVPDLLAGAAAEDASAGRLYVVSGATGAAIRSYLSPVNVEAEGFGRAVASVGDLNGDGDPDAIVGAPGADPPGTPGAGRVYAVDVVGGQVLWTAVSPNAEDDGSFGITLAAVPDVDGDGVMEVAVGATEESALDGGTLEEDAGRAYLLSGATGALLQSLVPVRPDDESATSFGTRGSDLGFALGATTDAAGRGVWLVGAPGEWEENFDVDPDIYSGRVYVVEPDGTAGRYRSSNSQNRGSFGHGVAGVPDLTGDGFGEVLVSAVDESLTPDGDDEGQVYLVDGATGAPIRRYASPQSYDDSSFGAVVAAVPDLTGDGRPDHLATETTFCCEKIDALYVFDAASGALAASVEVPTGDFEIVGAVGMPDLDGDGKGEVAVGVHTGTFDEVHYVVVVPLAADDAELEPNEALARPQRLGGVAPVVRGVASGGDLGFDGNVLLVAEGERAEDLFLVETTAPGLEVTLSGLTDDVDLYVLRPGDLTVLGSSTAGGPATERVSLPTLPPGEYLIAVDFYGSFGDASNSYDYSFYELRAEGSFTPPVATDERPAGAVALEPPSPNPARGRVALVFSTAAPGPVRLGVVDALGREVALLADGPVGAGRHTASLDVSGWAPGIYWVRLDAPGGREARPVTVVR